MTADLRHKMISTSSKSTKSCRNVRFSAYSSTTLIPKQSWWPFGSKTPSVHIGRLHPILRTKSYCTKATGSDRGTIPAPRRCLWFRRDNFKRHVSSWKSILRRWQMDLPLHLLSVSLTRSINCSVSFQMNWTALSILSLIYWILLYFNSLLHLESQKYIRDSWTPLDSWTPSPDFYILVITQMFNNLTNLLIEQYF